MLGIVPEEPSRQLSPPPKDAAIFYCTRKAETKHNPVQSFGITPRRGGGKARRSASPPPPPRHQQRPLGKADQEKEAAALGRPPTSSVPPHGGKNKQAPREATDAGAKCRRHPTASAAMRSPGAVLPSNGTEDGSETLAIPRLPSRNCSPRNTVTLNERKKKGIGELRYGLVGGTTARPAVRRYWWRWSGSR